MIRNNARVVAICDNHILLAKNIKKGFYFLPGGGLDFGESLQQAVIRELQEETILTASDFQVRSVIGIFENIFVDEYGDKYHTIENLVEVVMPHKPVISREGHLAFEWWPLDRLAEIRYYPELLGQKLVAWSKDRGFIVGVRQEF